MLLSNQIFELEKHELEWVASYITVKGVLKKGTFFCYRCTFCRAGEVPILQRSKARVLGRYLWWNALSGVSWIFSASVQHFLHNELWWCPKIQILRHASMACATVHRYHCCHLTFWRNSVQSKTSCCCWPTCKSIIAQLQSAQWSLWMFNLPPWRKTSTDKLHTCQLWHCTLH